jgi:hypothetical protein
VLADDRKDAAEHYKQGLHEEKILVGKSPV